MCHTRFSLFGKLSTHIDGREVACLEGRKLQELFCYLLIHRGRPHAREALASLLWADATTAQSRKNLRQTLWQLQSLLEVQQSGLPMAMVAADVEWICMDLPAGIWLDVAEFETAFEAVRATPGCELTTNQAEQLRTAVDLYRGDLLEGWYQDWCVYERERLQTMALAMLDRLASYCEAHGDYETGVFYGLRVLRMDRARESTHRRLMQLYALRGDRTSALRQYQACVVALAEELDVKPAARTVALYQQICADRFVPAAEAMRPGYPVVDADLAALRAAADYLRQLQVSISGLHTQVTHCMQTIEQSLRKANLVAGGD
jgi:DNA-binding SARP family transcriptional activator